MTTPQLNAIRPGASTGARRKANHLSSIRTNRRGAHANRTLTFLGVEGMGERHLEYILKVARETQAP